MSSDTVVGSDHYSTPESYRRLWDDEWRTMFQKGTWASGQPCSPINKGFDCYHPYACFACKRGPFTNNTKLFHCAQCSVAKYCCREHQRADWPSHKAWCKAFVALKNADDNDFRQLLQPKDMQTWRALANRVRSKVIRIAGAQRHTANAQLVDMQPRCRKCLAAGISPGVDLVTCPRCHGVALCERCRNADGEAFHSKDDDGRMECANHQISQACTGMVVEQGCPLCVESNTDARNFFRPKDWVEYFNVKERDFELPAAFLRMAPVMALVADGLSLPLTILHVLGMPAVLGKQEASKLDRLVLHLVGASAQEVMGISKFIELIRSIPTLTYLRVVLIGPDLDNFEECPLNFADPVMSKIRSSCDAKVMMRKGRYHDVIEDLDETPTLLVASHPGIFDGYYTESWRPTLELFAIRDVPFVVTGYNEQEVLNDCKHLEECGLRVVVKSSANPFRGLRPFPDPTRECSDFIYGNSHFIVTRGCDDVVD